MAWLKPRQWEPLAAVPIVAGAFWLFGGSGFGWWIWAAVPGCLMLSGFVSASTQGGFVDGGGSFTYNFYYSTDTASVNVGNQLGAAGSLYGARPQRV